MVAIQDIAPMIPIRNACLLALLTLGGCTVAETVTVMRARDALVGMNVVDLMGCAGIPDKVVQTTDAEILLQYDTKTTASTNGSSLTEALPFGLTAKFGEDSGECHFHARVFRDGTVAAVSFSGPMISDAAAICSGMVSECLMHPDQTELPKGFDAMKALLPAKAAK
jgi:hypothetical protein